MVCLCAYIFTEISEMLVFTLLRVIGVWYWHWTEKPSPAALLGQTWSENKKVREKEVVRRRQVDKNCRGVVDQISVTLRYHLSGVAVRN